MAVISVTQLNRYVGFKLKEDRMLQGLLVQGEITNFTNHYRSGHFYFTIRDEESSVKAVMFRSNAQRLRFMPEDGMRVIAAASASLYERDGAFQLCDRSSAGWCRRKGTGTGTAQEKADGNGGI